MPQTDTGRTTTARRGRRVLGMGALGAVAALTLSGCGNGVPPLEDVWPEVSESIQNAQSVTIDGEVAQGGQDVSVTMSGQIDDSSYAGSLSMGEAQVEVIGDADYTYMKPNEAFYSEMGGAPLQDLVGEKWLQVPAEDGFTMSTIWSSFSEDIPDADAFGDSDYTSEAVEHDGEEVYRYSGISVENGEPVALYVSKDNTLVRVEVEQGEAGEGQSGEATASPAADPGAGTVDFSDWDAVEPVEMPAEDDVFAVPGM